MLKYRWTAMWVHLGISISNTNKLKLNESSAINFQKLV